MRARPKSDENTSDPTTKNSICIISVPDGVLGTMVPGKFVVVLVSSSFLLSVSASADTSIRTLDSSISWNKPWFCHSSECPEYEVLESRLRYEKRKYKKGADFT